MLNKINNFEVNNKSYIMPPTEKVAVVWFKRDLRLHDNEAIYNAIKSGYSILFIYIFEPSMLADEHYSERHWNFIKQSITDINNQLEHYKTRVLAVTSEVIPFFSYLQSQKKIAHVFSHQETGIMRTFKRDKEFKRFCNNNSIDWVENVDNGVFRGRKNRDHWKEDWEAYMQEPLFEFNPKEASCFINHSEIDKIAKNVTIENLNTVQSSVFQPGGRAYGMKYLQSFLKDRHKNYQKFISKPNEARESCSRLSPYIAWGNLSVREIYQSAKEYSLGNSNLNKKSLQAFITRLRWQAHFIQKFEMECIMESESINKGYRKLKKEIAQHYQQAWKEGNTGIPIIDACMRCLQVTGYLNFRMRAMVVSFFTHNLWQPWQDASKFLSKVFLDFEPGVHFPQLQMQAGETGINTLRIYNPVKNGIEHDPDAKFITLWVPELKTLPIQFRHEPYLLTVLEQKMYKFRLGDDYPLPIVDIAKTRKKASDILWNLKKDKTVMIDNVRILNKHVVD